MGKIAEVEVAIEFSPTFPSLALFPLISFASVRDTVLGGQPPRRLRVILAEPPRVCRTALWITATSRTSPPSWTTAHFNGLDAQNSTLYYRRKMLNYGKFYGDFIFRSLESPVVPFVNISRQPGSSATENYYLNTTCPSPEARSPVGFPANQAGTSQSIGVTQVLESTHNPSLNWTGSSSLASISTDTVKLGGPESGLATRLKNHSFSTRLIVVRLLSLLGSVRRHERLLTRLIDIDDIPLVGKEGNIGSIILKIKLVRRIAGRATNPPLFVPQQVRGKRRAGDDCIGFVIGLSPFVM